MKNIFVALIIAVAVTFACNPPQSTTNPGADSTGVNNNNTRDTSMSNQRDTSSMPRDTSMRQ